MVFDGLKKFFNKIGNITVDSSEKVGGAVQAPVDKLGKIRPNIRPRRKPEEPETRPKEKPLRFKTAESNLRSRKTSSNVIRRKEREEDEIEIFKDLVEKRYRKTETPEKEIKKEIYQKAALEEILREEGKEQLEPKYIMLIGVVAFAVIFVAMVILGLGIEIGLIFGVLMLLMAGIIVYLPKMRTGSKSTEASRELPFALRQMATELRAGLGLHDSMRSVALAGYGPLSEEFARTLEEIRYGETTEKALVDMSERIQSDGLKRAVNQITRTLASGGDLAKTLNVIADDIAHELRMKLKDYAQKLNSFTMIYMFIAILGPVIVMVMMIAASTVMGPIIPPILLLIMYLFLFPMIVAFMAFMIKRLEPQI
jgi:archaeal flagellar protein FlaJ